MSTTITVTILATRTREAFPATTPAMGRYRFNRTYLAAHGDSAPDEVHTAPMWAGHDAAEAHETLCAKLSDDASTLDAVGDEGFVLLRGAGDHCDVWARFTF